MGDQSPHNPSVKSYYRLYVSSIGEKVQCCQTRKRLDLASEKWKSRSWIWLRASPDVVFFCAGDSGFAYNVVRVKEKFASKLVVYITDDYVLPRERCPHFRSRVLVFDKMKHAVKESDLFYTPSSNALKI